MTNPKGIGRKCGKNRVDEKFIKNLWQKPEEEKTTWKTRSWMGG
jgi:hypothetical protein